MRITEYIIDPKRRGKLILSLQRAIRSHFEHEDWQEFGYESGEHDYIQHHDRLLRSLYFGDGDYGASVYQVLEYLANFNPDTYELLVNHSKLRQQLLDDNPELAQFMTTKAQGVSAPSPANLAPGNVVLLALSDAERLMHSSAPVSAVDRLHTALHGYLRNLCADVGITVASDASLTGLFKALRNDHPLLQHLGSHDKDLVRILNGFATALDALNSLRNNGSIAHPSHHLLGEAEAHLAVDATKTIFNYVNAKIDH